MIVLKFLFSLIFVALIFIEWAYIRYYFGFPMAKNSIKITKDLKKVANIKKIDVNSRKVYIIKRKSLGEKKVPKILYIHGGAYVGGISIKHWKFFDNLLNDIECELIIPDYPLVPVANYKDVFDMIFKVYDSLENPNEMIFMGDSAGGAITLALTQKIGMDNRILPQKTILISPWLDITLKNEEINSIEEKDKVLNKQALKVAADVYSDDDDKNIFLLSPLNGPIDKITNLIIFTGTYDILNPDVHVFEKRFTNKNNIKIVECDGAAHNWIVSEDRENKYYKYLIEEIKKTYETT